AGPGAASRQAWREFASGITAATPGEAGLGIDGLLLRWNLLGLRLRLRGLEHLTENFLDGPPLLEFPRSKDTLGDDLRGVHSGLNHHRERLQVGAERLHQAAASLLEGDLRLF